MTDQNRKIPPDIEVSLGLVTGYLLAGVVIMVVSDKSWQEAFADEKILAGIAGVGLTYLIFFRNKNKRKFEDEEE